MLKHLGFLLALVLVAAVASATPVITSVTPNSSTVNGGIHITIKGDGFATCPICSPPVPPVVTFELTPSSSVRLVDLQTLDVVVPPHLPGTFDVHVLQFDGTATARGAFTFTGEVSDAFETILIPIYSPAIHGAFGSEFHTIARAATAGQGFVPVYGIDTTCSLADPPHYPTQPYPVVGEFQLPTECSQWPGRLLYVPKSSASLITFNDRVLDVSRSAQSNGTEIPIVRSSRFTSSRITLPGVPIDGRFRNTLRVYAMDPMTVQISEGGQAPRLRVLQPGRTMFEPAYVTFTDFPIPVDPGNEGTLTVTIDPPQPTPIGIPAGRPPLIWAFITVTNNVTQEITTITPDLP